MTRPDLAFSFSQLSKFLQYPGEAHLTASYRVLAYVKGTLHQGLSWHDPGADHAIHRRLVDQKAITKVTRVNSRLTQENARRRMEMEGRGGRKSEREGRGNEREGRRWEGWREGGREGREGREGGSIRE